jgi:uroporphyrinogen-III synthase
MSGLELRDRDVTLVHYGDRNTALVEALQARGCWLSELSLYEWQLPEDTGPLQDLIRDLVAGRMDAIAFTSQIQARHLFQVARDCGKVAALTQALNGRTVVAAIGPTCASALQRYGVTPDVVPDHPKMGHMVVALARHLDH